jgi:hypothetical protein
VLAGSSWLIKGVSVMKITRQVAIYALAIALPTVVAPVGLYATAQQAPSSDWQCEMYKDYLFSGELTTVRACRMYGFEMERKTWINSKSRLVCLTDELEQRRLFANEESDFDLVDCISVVVKSPMDFQ